jgi:hypothetical protein
MCAALSAEWRTTAPDWSDAATAAGRWFDQMPACLEGAICFFMTPRIPEELGGEGASDRQHGCHGDAETNWGALSS